LPLEHVARVRLISPRSELLELTRQLAALQYFHPKEEITPEPDRRLESILSNLRRVFVEIQEAASDLDLQDETPITEQLLKGYNTKKTVISVKDWEELAEYITGHAEPLLASYKALRNELTSLEKEIKEKTSALLSLKGLEGLNYNLETLEKMRWVKLFLFTTSNRNIPELKHALSDLLVSHVQISPENSLVLVVGSPKDGERITRIIRLFDAKPITVPRGAPANPLEAFREISTSLIELSESQRRIKNELDEFARRKGQEILTIKEAAKLVLSNLERLRKPPGFKRIVVVEGFVPYSNLPEFEKRMSKWIVHVERDVKQVRAPAHGGSKEPMQPTVLRNKRYFQAFEKITLTQGPPTPGELDPTPLIGLIFPVFYGLMFGDAGHGLVLTVFGLFMLKRIAPNLKPWAIMITAFGISAMISGLMVGEYFGLHGEEVPVLGGVFEPIHRFGARIGLTIETEEIPRLLGLAIGVGAFHLSLGFALDIAKKIRIGNNYEALTMSIPTFLWYVLGAIPFGVGLLQVNIDLAAASSSELPHLLFPFMTVGAVTNYIVLPTTAVCSLLIILSHPVGVLLRKHTVPLGDAVILGPIEWLLRMIEFLANSISYVRIGILLIIHATLVSVIRTFTYDNMMLLPAAIIFNLLVIALEGMIVFIQALRLHLYEWFTKFYEGGGEMFEGLSLDGKRVRIQLVG
jgi:V/A-type H+-transporting ATPase subunit I